MLLLLFDRLPSSVLVLSALTLLSLAPPIAASPSSPLPPPFSPRLVHRQDTNSTTASSAVAVASSAVAATTTAIAISSSAAEAPTSTTSSSTAEAAAASIVSTKVQDYSGFNPPANKGGKMLTIVNGTFPAGLGEPLNIIISSQSSAEVLVDSADNGGFRNFILGLQFSDSCLGLAATGGQSANLGDGQGDTIQVDELRENFGDIYFGTCTETFNGGNHFRYWKQATTGAWFMASSIEQNLAAGHDIVVNGYDLGRDDMVARATGQDASTINTLNVNENSTYTGTSSYGNYTYTTEVRYVTGLLQNSSDGINHYLSVPPEGRNAIDGLATIWTVKITTYPPGTKASSAFSILSFSRLGPTLFAVVAVSSLALLI